MTHRAVRCIRRHPLTSFFALAFALSWSIWGASSLMRMSAPTLATSLVALGGFGPAAAAVLVACTTDPARVPTTRSRWRVIAAATVFVMAAGASIGTAAGAAADSWAVLSLVTLVVLCCCPAVLVWTAWSRCRGVRQLLSSLREGRVRLAWYAAAMLVMPVISLLGWCLSIALDLPSNAQTPQPPDSTPLLPLVLLSTALFGGPLGEEVGWRGFALPRLQQRVSPAVASLWLGLGWAAWHIPLHLRGLYDSSMGAGLGGLFLRVVSQVGLAVIFTWLYNHTSGSLPVMIVLHTSVNISSAGLWWPQTVGATLLVGVLVVVLIVSGRMYRRPLAQLRRAPRPRPRPRETVKP